MKAPESRSAGTKPASESRPGGQAGMLVFGRLQLDLRFLGPAIIVAAAATYVALTQPLYPNPFETRPLWTWQGWAYPVEINAHKRWPIVTGAINDIAVRGMDGVAEV